MLNLIITLHCQFIRILEQQSPYLLILIYIFENFRSQTPLKKDTDDMPDGEEKGPDIIPANIINRAYYSGEIIF